MAVVGAVMIGGKVIASVIEKTADVAQIVVFAWSISVSNTATRQALPACATRTRGARNHREKRVSVAVLPLHWGAAKLGY